MTTAVRRPPWNCSAMPKKHSNWVRWMPAHWQGLLEAQKIREDHLKNLRDFNQTSVRIQYLRGSFNTQNP